MNACLVVDSLPAATVLSNRVMAIFTQRGPQEVIIRDLEHNRSTAQNRLSFFWYKHIAVEFGDRTAEDVRAYCKLHIGVPIRREDEVFREVYDRVIRPLSYEEKLELMRPPIDFPVTRDMSTKAMTRYLGDMEQHFAEQGIVLPRPDDLYRYAMGGRR